MLRYMLGRTLAGLITLIAATIAVAYLIHLVPGDPVRLLYATSQATTDEDIEIMRHDLGLDLPIHEQYFQYMSRILRGDWGKTIRGKQAVFPMLMIAFPNTLLLTVASLLISVVVGVPIGFISAYRRGSRLDTSLMVTSMVGISIPHFWLGLLLIYVFALKLHMATIAESGLKGLLLPAITLGFGGAASLARMTRSSMLDVLNQDFIRTARAKGLREAVVLYRHVLRAGLMSIVTLMGLQFVSLMGGAVVVENVFAWNGVGRLAITNIFQRDYPTIQGFLLLFAAIVVAVSLFMDIVYGWIDPRVSRE
jgi:ABC-type dipeptide/oligopeptide/nickel transport system permease component